MRTREQEDGVGYFFTRPRWRYAQGKIYACAPLQMRLTNGLSNIILWHYKYRRNVFFRML